MRKKIFISYIFLLSFNLYSQQIDNKLNFYVGYHLGTFQGNETEQEGTYYASCLYANFRSVNGFSLKGLLNGHNLFSYGAAIDYSIASGWDNAPFDDYQGSRIIQYSLYPSIQFHNKFTETGISNWIKFFLEVGPTAGMSNLKLKEPVFEVQNENGTIISLMESKDFFFGMKGAAGIDFSLSQTLGAFINFSIERNRVSSELYTDRYFVCPRLEAGFFVRFYKNKYYYYR